MFKHFIQWLVSLVCVCIIMGFLTVFFVNVITWQKVVQKEAFDNLPITEQWTQTFWKNYGSYLK